MSDGNDGAGIVYDLVLLWYAARLHQGLATGWPARLWYRSKTTPACLDVLTAVRQEARRVSSSDPPLTGPATQESAHSQATDLLATASWRKSSEKAMVLTMAVRPLRLHINRILGRAPAVAGGDGPQRSLQDSS